MAIWAALLPKLAKLASLGKAATAAGGAAGAAGASAGAAGAAGLAAGGGFLAKLQAAKGFFDKQKKAGDIRRERYRSAHPSIQAGAPEDDYEFKRKMRQQQWESMMGGR